MAQASRDQNRIPTLIVCSSDDLNTPINLYVDPVTHVLSVNMAVDPLSPLSVAKRDQNRVTTLLGVSKDDGSTPVAVCGSPDDHALLVEPTV